MTPHRTLTPEEIRRLEDEFKEAEANLSRKTEVYQRALAEHEAADATLHAAAQKRRDAYSALRQAEQLKGYIASRLASANGRKGDAT